MQVAEYRKPDGGDKNLFAIFDKTNLCAIPGLFVKLP